MFLQRLSARGAYKISLVASAVWLSIPVALAGWLFLRPVGPTVADLIAEAPESAADAPRQIMV